MVNHAICTLNRIEIFSLSEIFYRIILVSKILGNTRDIDIDSSCDASSFFYYFFFFLYTRFDRRENLIDNDRLK